jgi:predicted flap endonuclease-1-like 5' DNA nuclease
MAKLLRRLLLLGLLILIAAVVASRVLNREEDFDDYDDIDMGLDFTETPVEIDVPADSAPMAASASAMADTVMEATEDVAEDTSGNSAGQERTLTSITGIGPTYAARLKDAGITSVSDLAGANADSLAEKVEVIGGRATIEDWIKQAQGSSSSGTSGAK